MDLEASGNTSNWQNAFSSFELNEGENTIELRAKSNSASDIYLDNFVIEPLFELVSVSAADITKQTADLNTVIYVLSAVAVLVTIAGIVIIAAVCKKKI